MRGEAVRTVLLMTAWVVVFAAAMAPDGGSKDLGFLLFGVYAVLERKFASLMVCRWRHAGDPKVIEWVFGVVGGLLILVYGSGLLRYIAR